MYKLFSIGAALFISLASTAQHKIPVDSSYNVNNVYRQISGNYPMAVPAKDSLPVHVKATRNLVYNTLEHTLFGKRELHLDVFQPKSEGLHPALIMIHGGGWRSGTRYMQVPLAQQLAAKGLVTVPVEYQLSLEAKYPAAIHNIKAAIRWIKTNAATYQIDTNRIAISGCSAGGHLAALTGLTNGLAHFEGTQGVFTTSSKVHAIVDIDGVVDFLAPASLNLVRKPDSPDIEWLGGSYSQKPDTWKEASPVFWATKETVVPILFLNSGYSRFHAGQDELIGMMKEWGKYTEVYKFDVMVHPFWLFHPWIDTTTEVVARFLRAQLPAAQ